MRNERESRLDGIRFEAHVRAHKPWDQTPIAMTHGARATDPFAGVRFVEDWYERAYQADLRAVRAAEQREENRKLVNRLDRLARHYIHDRGGRDGVEEENRALGNNDGVEEEQRSLAGADDNVGRHFGKASDSIGEALGRFAKDHDVDSPFWRMLRDTLERHGAKTIGSLDHGTRRFANYLIGRLHEGAHA
jgi:hypothetical protein